jgi:PTH2 family peptidyl-tRNA hydrolase
MSPGKLAAQVSHASMAFLTTEIRQNNSKYFPDPYNNNDYWYISQLYFNKEIMENWMCGSFTKVVCEAKNRNQLMKVVDKAKELGLVEGRDFFLIRDNCLTELEPEEEYPDVNGELHGCTLTCIGFKPLEDEVAQQLSKKYQLYK